MSALAAPDPSQGCEVKIRKVRRQKALAFENGCVWGAAVVAWAQAIADRQPSTFFLASTCEHGLYTREFCQACEDFENEEPYI